MYPVEKVEEVVRQRRAGRTYREISLDTGVSIHAIRVWLADPRRAIERRTLIVRPEQLPPAEYAYLLGLYLGDGHIVRCRKGIYRLELSLDAAYPGIAFDAMHGMASVLPTNWVGVYRCRDKEMFKVMCQSKKWPMLLPQHGPGRKHTRLIELTEWQKAITTSEPEALLRGLMHSDGSRFVARQRVGDKVYEYARYAFSNKSEDIKRIFCQHLDLLGVRWTRPNAKLIAIDRRPEVAKLDAFIGPKT